MNRRTLRISGLTLLMFAGPAAGDAAHPRSKPRVPLVPQERQIQQESQSRQEERPGLSTTRRSAPKATTASPAKTGPVGSQPTCLHPLSGNLIFDVQSCNLRSGEQFFRERRADQNWFWNIPKNEQNIIAQSYTGIMLRGTVIHSSAKRKDMDASSGELLNQAVDLFFPMTRGQCQAYMQKRFAGVVEESCCDGAARSPCLYQTPYMLKSISLLGASRGLEGNQEAFRAQSSPSFQRGIQAFRKQDFQGAIQHLEEARSRKELDPLGAYSLAVSYRKLEMCEKAVPVLRPLHERWEKGEFWAGQEKIIRKAVFLLARCYAMTENVAGASLILNNYLAYPKKYSEEIAAARTHADFGWIKSTREYRQFYDDSGKIRFR